VETHGTSDWALIASIMEGKNIRQCKERWTNYLSPGLNVEAWTHEDDLLLVRKYMELGNKWVKIAKFFPNRTDSMVKNRFNKLQRRDKRTREMWTRSDYFMFQGCGVAPNVPPEESIQMLNPQPFHPEEAISMEMPFFTSTEGGKPFAEDLEGDVWVEPFGCQASFGDIFGC
jgi:hypothetical protein